MLNLSSLGGYPSLFALCAKKMSAVCLGVFKIKNPLTEGALRDCQVVDYISVELGEGCGRAGLGSALGSQVNN